ncbi:hypothetical protein [Burkholderia cepacia]|uniref:hypothetical protein n=1 Tax=Burkholderia cepacia TaxID=292 RepID=UPI000F5F44C4|nr:hypothetical protein [Burkholderia cepacia]
MHDLTGFRASNLSMLPLAAAPLAAIAESMRFDERCVRPIRLFGARINDRCCFGNFGNGGHHPIPPPCVFAITKSLNLLGIRIKRITMAMPHLVMAGAQFSCGDGAITVLASAANYLSAPSILRRSMLFKPLVVHQAKAICSMFPTAAFNAANLVKNWRCHSSPISLRLPKFYRYKALGNSMARTVMHWIGRHIELVESLTT